MPHPKAPQEQPAKGVDALDRAFAILRCFSAEQPRLSLTEIAQQTGLYKSTILRLAVSLEKAGLLLREADKYFTLGAETMRLGAVYARGFRLEPNIRPLLQRLRHETGESAAFFRREGEARICLFREDSHHPLRDHIREGDMLALNQGAAGHVLRDFSAALPHPAQLRPLLASMPVLSIGERDRETAAMAAPVFATDNALAGALSISGPKTRFTSADVARMAPPLLRAAREASARLGGGQLWLPQAGA